MQSGVRACAYTKPRSRTFAQHSMTVRCGPSLDLKQAVECIPRCNSPPNHGETECSVSKGRKPPAEVWTENAMAYGSHNLKFDDSYRIFHFSPFCINKPEFYRIFVMRVILIDKNNVMNFVMWILEKSENYETVYSIKIKHLYDYPRLIFVLIAWCLSIVLEISIPNSYIFWFDTVTTVILFWLLSYGQRKAFALPPFRSSVVPQANEHWVKPHCSWSLGRESTAL